MSLYLALLLTTFINKILAQCPLGFNERGKSSVCYDVPKLYTLSNGCPIDSEIGWLGAGYRGPLLLADNVLLDDYKHFQTEKIAERVVHATGSGAMGYFKFTDPLFAKYCKASLFKAVGKKTEVLVRFSVGSGGTGVCDTARRGSGMAIKFYTDDGNWDLLCINAPVIAARDGISVPSFIHAVNEDPRSGLTNLTAFWDICSLRHETVHFLMFTFSDRGLPADYRHTNFFPVNAYKVVNDCGEVHYVKFTIKTDQGIMTYNDSYAETICASDPDHARRDLYTSISDGNHPSWTLHFQVMTPKEADKMTWNPFDATKVWPHGEFPMYKIGNIVLTKNTPNHFACVEQAAFCPGNMVPGIEPSPDMTFPARMFVYRDTQRYRLGKNHHQLPINRPKVTVQNLHRDGFMIFDNQNGKPNYYPNSEGYNTCPEAAWSKWPVCGDVARYNTKDDYNYDQPRNFWLYVLNDDQKEFLVLTLCASLRNVDTWLQERSVSMFCKVDKCFGERVAACLAS